MEVRQRFELTPGDGGVNADSRLKMQLKLLTPLKPNTVNEKPHFATDASANSPENGYRRTCKRRGSLRALAVGIAGLCHDGPVKGRPDAENQAAAIFFSWAASRPTFREPVFL